MASSAASTTTRLGRVLHWLFPSRRAVLAAAAVEVAASLIGLPLPLHLLVGVAAHLALTISEGRG
jgi:hypothetical protein